VSLWSVCCTSVTVSDTCLTPEGVRGARVTPRLQELFAASVRHVSDTGAPYGDPA
jgi:hypothetical protein